MIEIAYECPACGCLHPTQQVVAECKRINAATANEAWPLVDVLSKLTEAAELFLGSYNYDGHGHEELIVCVERAKTILAAMRSDTSKGKSHD